MIDNLSLLPFADALLHCSWIVIATWLHQRKVFIKV